MMQIKFASTFLLSLKCSNNLPVTIVNKAINFQSCVQFSQNFFLLSIQKRTYMSDISIVSPDLFGPNFNTFGCTFLLCVGANTHVASGHFRRKFICEL